MDSIEYRTAGGVRVTRAAEPCAPDVLDELVAAVAHRRGGVLSSGMEYPGRYSRWHLAYADPCVEIVARGRRVEARALNDRGRVVMPVIREALLAHGTPTGEPTPARVEVVVPEGEGGFTEEERSRRPTVFSPLRDVIATFSKVSTASPAGDSGFADDPHLGLYGAFGYDLAFQFEPVRPRLDRGHDARDLVLHLPDALIVRDRKRETCVRYTYEFTVGDASTRGLPRETEPAPATPAPSELPPEPRPGAYAAVVRDAKERFVRGDLFEVVPGHVMYAPCSDPAAFYERLRHRNPAPYEFFFNLGADSRGEVEHLVGASPEMYVRVTGDRVETCPISGTIRRGADPLEDADNIRTLLTSAKEESELTMCTDVDRNDKSRICVPGSVKVIGRRQIEMYSRLIHTVDHIEGRLRPGFDALDAFLTHMWAVTVTGAPKTWAMQFIEDHEETPRRWYGGAVGFLGFDGSMNTGLTLRTAQIRGGVASVRAGATLLYDSDPEAEEAETRLKARALLETLREGEEPAAAPSAAADADTWRAQRPGEGMSVLLVDHEDSFVNTLADYFRRLGAQVTTLRHGFPPALLDTYAPDLVVLSPGPGRPEDFDCAGLLKELDARGLPVFGVCLGLQAMVEHTGGTLSLLPEPVHGKPGRIRTLRPDGKDGDGPSDRPNDGLLAGLGEEFTAARYHSLHAMPEDVRGDFRVTAATPDGAVMAIEDPAARRWAVQFHPESILTASGGAGERLIGNVLRLVRDSSPTTAATD